VKIWKVINFPMSFNKLKIVARKAVELIDNVKKCGRKLQYSTSYYALLRDVTAVVKNHSADGGPSSILVQVMYDLWWTEWHWGRFSPSPSVSPANSHPIQCPTLTYHPGLVQ
jgi:hypothetical protein